MFLNAGLDAQRRFGEVGRKGRQLPSAGRDGGQFRPFRLPVADDARDGGAL